MRGKLFLENSSSARGETTRVVTQKAPGYLTRQEAQEILTEMLDMDSNGRFITPVSTHAFCSQRIYVTLAANLPEEYQRLSCAGLCFIQLLEVSSGTGCVRVAALPSHLESASPRKVRQISLREEQLRVLLSWDRALQRLETCCVRDVLQMYASLIGSTAAPADVYATGTDAQLVQVDPAVDQREQPEVVGAALPEQVFVPVEIALDLIDQLKAENRPKRCSPPFFWLKAILKTLQQQYSSLSTFEMMLFKMVRHLKKHWRSGKLNRARVVQIQATPVRQEQTCLGWSLLLAFPQDILRTWGF